MIPGESLTPTTDHGVRPSPTCIRTHQPISQVPKSIQAPQLTTTAGAALVVQQLRPHASTAGGTGSIPGLATKFPHAACSVTKRKKKKNRWPRARVSKPQPASGLNPTCHLCLFSPWPVNGFTFFSGWERVRGRILRPLNTVWISPFDVHRYRFMETGRLACCLWLLLHCNGRAESLHRNLSSSQMLIVFSFTGEHYSRVSQPPHSTPEGEALTWFPALCPTLWVHLKMGTVQRIISLTLRC